MAWTRQFPIMAGALIAGFGGVLVWGVLAGNWLLVGSSAFFGGVVVYSLTLPAPPDGRRTEDT